MSRKERFLMFVWMGAIARDLAAGSGEAALIATQAKRIPETRIPRNTINAAAVFIRWAQGDTRPHRWMVPATATVNQGEKR